MFALFGDFCNPSLGLTTKARGSQGCGPRKKPGSARECEGIDPHTPKGTPTLGVGIPLDSQIFKVRLQGSNPLHRGVLYINGKILKRRCLKWAHMTHLDI